MTLGKPNCPKCKGKGWIFKGHGEDEECDCIFVDPPEPILPMKTRIMLDLETLGTAPGSAILAIGAVHFGDGKIHSEFYRRVNLKSCLQFGLKMDPETVMWWLKQPDEARLEITKDGIHLAAAIQQLSEWFFEVGVLDETEVWGNGASFDNVLLSVAYQHTGHTRPWKYSNDRCYRTVKNLYPDVPLPRTGTHHNALDDARSQAMHLMAMLPQL